MAFSPFNRFEQMPPGSNPNTWGDRLNRLFGRMDEALDGAKNIAVSGDYYLNYSNESADEAHYSAFVITGGTGGRVFLQNVPGSWLVHNASANDIAFTVNGVQDVTVEAGVITIILSNGQTVRQFGPSGVQSLKSYIDENVQEAKNFAEELAFESVTGTLPNQATNTGKFLKTNGTTPSWGFPTIADVPGLQAELDDIRDEAIAAALIF